MTKVAAAYIAGVEERRVTRLASTDTGPPSDICCHRQATHEIKLVAAYTDRLYRRR